MDDNQKDSLSVAPDSRTKVDEKGIVSKIISIENRQRSVSGSAIGKNKNVSVSGFITDENQNDSVSEMIIDSSQKDGVSDITVEENQKNCRSDINVDSNQTNFGLGIGSDLNRKKFRKVRCSKLCKGKVAEHITERLFTVAGVMNNEHEEETSCETNESNSLPSGIV